MAKKMDSKVLKRKILIMSIWVFVCTALFCGSLFSLNYIEKINPLKTAADFDKQTDDTNTYSKVELDIITPFLFATKKDYNSIDTQYEEYYLYKNSQTNEYGILSFDDVIIKENIFKEKYETKKLNSKITLYGITKKIPNYVLFETTENNENLNNQNNSQTNSVEFNTITMPDGETIKIPQTSIPSGNNISTPPSILNSETITDDFRIDAINQFFDCEIDDSKIDLGSSYLCVIQPKTEKHILYKVVSVFCVISLFAVFVLIAIMIYLAVKYDPESRKQFLEMTFYEDG